MIHAFKPDPVTNRQEAWRFFDFVGMHPESLHMVTWLKSPWGIPANYREMEGSGVNTYKLVNDEGEALLCKFHWIPKQGVRNLTSAQAAEIQAKDVGHATRDLYDNIRSGNFPEWEFCVQIMPDGPNEHLSLRPARRHQALAGRPVPAAARRPHGAGPRAGQLLRRSRAGGLRHRRAGRRHRLLGRQDAAGPHAVLFGHAALPRRRRTTCSCRSTRRSRASRPTPTSATARWPSMSTAAPNAARQLRAERARAAASRRRRSPPKDYHQPVEGHLGRYQTSRATDDYTQAGDRYRSFQDWERDDLIANLVGDMKQCPEPIQLRMVWHFWHCDEDYGRRVAEGAGHRPREGQGAAAAAGRALPRARASTMPTYTDGKAEEGATAHAPNRPPASIGPRPRRSQAGRLRDWNTPAGPAGACLWAGSGARGVAAAVSRRSISTAARRKGAPGEMHRRSPAVKEAKICVIKRRAEHRAESLQACNGALQFALCIRLHFVRHQRIDGRHGDALEAAEHDQRIDHPALGREGVARPPPARPTTMPSNAERRSPSDRGSTDRPARPEKRPNHAENANDSPIDVSSSHSARSPRRPRRRGTRPAPGRSRRSRLPSGSAGLAAQAPAPHRADWRGPARRAAPVAGKRFRQHERRVDEIQRAKGQPRRRTASWGRTGPAGRRSAGPSTKPMPNAAPIRPKALARSSGAVMSAI